MSKYDKETKFYWLQLKEDFFENDAIEWLEDQEPNGRDYAYFYLKLCLKSLKSNGVLIRKVGNILIPYDNKKLAELTKMDFDTVTVAMELLKKIGLIKILENGEIYIDQLEQLIGSKSAGAFKKQQQRILGGQKADICPPKIEIESEIEIEQEIEPELEDGLIDINYIINNRTFIQNETDKYNEIFKNAHIFFDDVETLPSMISAQVKLYQIAIKHLADTRPNLIIKVTPEKLDSVFSNVINYDGIKNIEEYFITSLINKLEK